MIEDYDELILLSPQKCQNCGFVKQEYTLIQEPDGFKYKVNLLKNCDWQCPKCSKKFCSHCFVADIEGSGNTVFCPHCHTKLRFPATMFYDYHELN